MSEPREPTDHPSDDCKNGFILSEIFIPGTVLEIVLSYVPLIDILKLREVCQSWKDIVCRRSWWKKVFDRNGLILNWTRIPDLVIEKEEAWKDFSSLASVFTKNLVRNHSGHEQLSHWEINSTGDAIIVESPPVGVNPLPADPRFNGEVDSAFVMSYGCTPQSAPSAIRQKINLMEVGLTPEIMRATIPFQFILSNMVGVKSDSVGKSSACLALLDSDGEPVVYSTCESIHEAGEDWVYSSCTLNVLEPTQLDKVCHLVVMLEGKEEWYGAGYCGPKFSRIAITTKCLAPQEAQKKSLQQFDTRISQEVRNRFFRYLWSSEEDDSQPDDYYYGPDSVADICDYDSDTGICTW